MVPFKEFEKEVILKKPPYDVFREVDKLDLTKKVFDSNAFDLIAVFEQTDPLLISFRNETDYMGRKRYNLTSPVVFATVFSYQGGSRVVFRVKTDPLLYIILVIMVLCLFFNVKNSGPLITSSVFAIILLLLVPMDLYTRRSILSRAQMVVSQYD